MTALRAVVAAVLLGSGCAYDARVSVDVPAWDPLDASAVVPLGGCSGEPLVIGFALVDDRGAPIRAGETIGVTGAKAKADPSLIGGAIEGATVDGTAIPDQPLTDPRWHPGPDGDVLAVAVEASAGAAAQDPSDTRITAAELAARDWLATAPRRVAVYAFANASIDQRLPPASDVNAAAAAIDAIAPVQGGDAPIFDGAIQAASDIRLADTGGGSLLLIGAQLVDRGSIAAATNVITNLATAPHVSLYAAALADAPGARQIACATGGAFATAATIDALPALAVALSGAAGGSWVAKLAPPAGLASGPHVLDGMLRVTLAGDSRLVPISFTFDVP